MAETTVWGIAVFGETNWWLFLPVKPVDKLAEGWSKAQGYWLYPHDAEEDTSSLLELKDVFQKDPFKTTVLKDAIFAVDIDVTAVENDPENGRKRFKLDAEERDRLDTMYSDLQDTEKKAREEEKLRAKAEEEKQAKEESEMKAKADEEARIAKEAAAVNGTAPDSPPQSTGQSGDVPPTILGASVAHVGGSWYRVTAEGTKKGTPLSLMNDSPGGTWFYHEVGKKEVTMRSGKATVHNNLPSTTMTTKGKVYCIIDVLKGVAAKKPVSKLTLKPKVEEESISASDSERSSLRSDSDGLNSDSDSDTEDAFSSSSDEYYDSEDERRNKRKRGANVGKKGKAQRKPAAEKKDRVEKKSSGAQRGTAKLMRVGCDDYKVMDAEVPSVPIFPSVETMTEKVGVVRLPDGTLACYDADSVAEAQAQAEEEEKPKKQKKRESRPPTPAVVDPQTAVLGDLLDCISDAKNEQQKHE